MNTENVEIYQGEPELKQFVFEIKSTLYDMGKTTADVNILIENNDSLIRKLFKTANPDTKIIAYNIAKAAKKYEQCSLGNKTVKIPAQKYAGIFFIMGGLQTQNNLLYYTHNKKRKQEKIFYI